jgi:predicted nucleic acid-binding protein
VEPSCFLDTNVFIRFLAADHDVHTPIAKRCIEAIERGHLAVETSETVIFETIFTMTSRYGADRNSLASTLRDILSLEGVRLPYKREVLKAMELWTQFRRLSFADAYHLTLTAESDHKRIFSFDKGIDRALPGVERIEELP